MSPEKLAEPATTFVGRARVRETLEASDLPHWMPRYESRVAAVSGAICRASLDCCQGTGNWFGRTTLTAVGFGCSLEKRRRNRTRVDPSSAIYSGRSQINPTSVRAPPSILSEHQ